MDLKKLFSNIAVSGDLKAKLKGAKSKEEYMNLLKEENVELNQEQIDALAGGCWFDDKPGCNYHCNMDVLDCDKDFCTGVER